ncbi:peptidylprolyl isomerase [Paenibacillus sp. NEAU-GSW1]|uniref:peptidylprolyl isomerase n=1 Tax=Paenibacillus sp. NEAU-GSW1 TaxID=2682486 RepID=UPI0012E2935B|nr:peptidylprolyl isomerase [Paenibacillus sp. NEAU-GSW1]MUT67902.1 peptidylprolyl isomerase [Paenibacillus sp. NEAU-GSW1]
MKRNRTHLKMVLLLVAALMLVITAGCGGGSKKTEGAGGAATAQPTKAPSPSPSPTDAPVIEGDGPVVTIEMDNGEKIRIELFPETAPNTVNNFISLVKKGFYDGLIFHRVIPDFMIQGGDPDGIGTGGPGYGIKGEFSSNGFENKLKHTRGVISMARSQMMDSAGSQFFIMTADNSGLDGQYAAFGRVLEGLETVDKIVNQKRDASDRPLEPMKMAKVTVDTKGVTYPEPETIAE